MKANMETHLMCGSCVLMLQTGAVGQLSYGNFMTPVGYAQLQQFI